MKKLFRKFSLFAFFSTILLVSCKKETPAEPKKQYTVSYHCDLPPSGQVKIINYTFAGHNVSDTLTFVDTFDLICTMESGERPAISVSCNITIPYAAINAQIQVNGATVSHDYQSGTGYQVAYTNYLLQ